jgi:ubiquinone/menaquinone biosynthesis C-methylase UbiE
MSHSAITPPVTDPTSIFEHFRGGYGSELLTLAVAHFDIFARLSRTPMSLGDLAEELGLDPRPAVVLVTALRAMGLLTVSDGRLSVTELATEHLVPGGNFDCGDYIGLAAQSPGVLGMLQLLKTNQPLGSDDDSGAAFIYHDGLASAMDSEDSARHFTMALAGRAKNVAPLLADAVPMQQARRLLDVGGGTGIYSFAMLQKYPRLEAIVMDRAEVLKIAAELAREYGVSDRVQFVAGDMFADELPTDCDVILLSNVLHDWDVPQCQQLIDRCADVLQPGGRLLIHDVFLNDNMDGPLPIALYSAALFSLTEGRAYSAAEYREWLRSSGFEPSAIAATLVHCGVLSAEKR